MDKIFEIMPEGWEEAAIRERALVQGRNIKTPRKLLRLNFLYQTQGETYGLTTQIVCKN